MIRNEGDDCIQAVFLPDVVIVRERKCVNLFNLLNDQTVNNTVEVKFYFKLQIAIFLVQLIFSTDL